MLRGVSGQDRPAGRVGPSTATVLGTVTRLQVQRARLKPGVAPHRAYDPGPLLAVPELAVGPRGVLGRTAAGAEVLDVHHADHPDSRNRRLANGLSLLPAAHYALLRQAFGDHLVHGSAGESLLLQTAGPWTEQDLVGDLVLETCDGPPLALLDVAPMPPCLEFTRFCLGREPGSPVDDEVLAALASLGDGRRGFMARPGASGRVSAGCRLLRT